MKPTILIINNANDGNEILAQMLRLSGYTALIAENGMKGLEEIEGKTPDLILCAIEMPGLDGFGVLRAIQNIPLMNNVPFIFLGNKTDGDGHFRKGMNMGADDYLINPVLDGDMLEIISSRIRKSLLIKQKFEKDNKKITMLINDSSSFFDIFSSSSYKVNKKVKLKQLIYMEGDLVNFVFCIVKGKVKTFKTNEDGKEIITGLFKEGDIFGHASFLEEYQQESCAAIENSELLCIPKDDFLQILDSNSEVAQKLIIAISGHFLGAGEAILRLAYNTSSQKIANALLIYDSKYRYDGQKDFPFNRSDISTLAGVAKESVSRKLTDFQTKGWIAIDPKTGNVTILNYGKLESPQA